ncbi:MAG: hypothetical protein L0H41_04970 [Microlunatus sp.]|nr:hypothetical protein [Microlunatus sp.]MDN5769593.1 hypothetical protein [Microlunatus sp.]
MLGVRKRLLTPQSTRAVPLLASGLSVAAPEQASAREPQCRVTMDTPHYSSGAKGMIAKARFSCDTSASQVYVSNSVGIKGPCDKPLPNGVPDLDWDNGKYGCKQSAAAGYSTVTVKSGKTETRYAPASGQPGLKKVTGKYYRAYVFYRYKGSEQYRFYKLSASFKA